MRRLRGGGAARMVGWILLAACLLPDGTAHAQRQAEKLVGPLRDPRVAPSNPDLIAFGRLERDAQELYLYHRASGAVAQIQARRDDAPLSPASTPFTDLFEEQNLDQFSRYDGQLAWRPRLDAGQRQWFAFVSGGSGTGFDVYLSYVDAAGRLAPEAPIRLPFDGLEQFPEWSPDGQQLAFVSGNASGSDLYLVPAMGPVLASRGRKGFRPIRLTANPALEGYPAWSPDGQYIAFQTLTRQDDRLNWGISVVHLEDVRGVSAPQPVPLTDELSAYDEFKPSWSPDGQHLAFYVSQARVDAQEENLQQDIDVVGVVKSGRGERIVRGRLLSGFTPRLAENVIPHRGGGPRWMPLADALLLVYVKRDAPARFPIFLTDFSRWQARQQGYEQALSPEFGTQYHREPVLAALPSGMRVVFVSQEGGANRLQVFDRPGPARRITIPVERRRSSAIVRSLVVPGLGQWYKGQRAKGLALLAAEAVALGGGVLLLSEVDPGAVDALESAYRRSVPADAGCLAQGAQPCRNAAFAAWQDAYDRAEARQRLALAAFGVAAGVWLVNLIDSATGFPRALDRPVRLAHHTPLRPSAGPHLARYGGAPHYGLRLRLSF